jgi:hypothetical protein
MPKYAITDNDQARHERAQQKAAEKDVRNALRKTGKWERQCKRAEKKMHRTIQHLIREARREYRRGGEGCASKWIRISHIPPDYGHIASEYARELGATVNAHSERGGFQPRIHLCVKVLGEKSIS